MWLFWLIIGFGLGGLFVILLRPRPRTQQLAALAYRLRTARTELQQSIDRYKER